MCLGTKQSSAQYKATLSQSDLADTMAQIGREREAFQQPYLKSRVQGGLPFLPQMLDFKGGTIARSLAPARASLVNRLSASGNELPSGFKEQSLTDFDVKKARAFDDSIIQALLLDEESRARAAGLSSSSPFFSGAQQGLGSVMNQPTQPNPWGNIIGGAISGLVGLGG